MGIDGRKTAAIMAVAAAGLAMMASQAAEFTLSAAPETLSDWKNVSFYTGDAAPTGASTDVVNMPAGMTVTVSGTNSDVVAFLGSIARLMANAGAQFILDVPQTASPLEFSGKVQQVDGVKTPAWFIKRGEGDLKLMGTASSAYNVNLHVEKGTVRLPPVASGSYNYYGSVVVDAGATIYTMGTGYWQVRGLHGAGLVTNDNATACSVYVMSPESIMPWGGAFSGAIGGKLSIMLRNGRLQLTGSGNAISSEITVSSDASYGGAQKATLELASLGNSSDAITSTGPGRNALFSTSGSYGRLLYLGQGETSDRSFRFVIAGQNVIDGGLYGGLRLTGSFARWSTTAINPLVVLDGSNTLSACEFAMGVDQYSYNSVVHNYYIRKQGTGEWKFPVNSRYLNTGVMEVRNGKLSFASLEEAGYACSLGYSTRLYAAGSNTSVPYAFLLGDNADAGAVGMMEYTGATTALCTTRPFSIAGTGGLRTADGAGALKLRGFTSADASGTNTLVLAGDGAADNWASDITNGVGTVGVRKEGSGSWTIGGALDFSGPLEVLGGTLTVTNPAPEKYSHFRLLVKEIAYSNQTLKASHGSAWYSTDTFGISEIGLYGSDNKRCGLGLTAASDYADIAPGQVAFGWHKTVSATGALQDMFDNSRSAPSTGSWNGLQASFGKAPTLSDPSSWVPIDMRLPASAPAITHYDVCKSFDITANSGGRVSTAFALYGTVDGGLHWELLGAETDTVSSSLSGTYMWTQTLVSFTDGETKAHPTGWPVESVPTPRSGQLANISGVTLAGGATLRFLGPGAPALDSVTVDVANGGGRIEGFAFAAAGTLDVRSLESDESRIALPLTVAPGTDLSGWTVSIDGTPMRHGKLLVGADGCVTVAKAGTSIILR